jgi:hypothetical protein
MRFLIAIIALFWSSASMAQATSGGPLLPLFVSTLNTGVGLVYFRPAAKPTSTAPCVHNIGGTDIRYAFDTSTAGGKSQLALLLTASAAGIAVWYQGTGDCGVDGTDETLAQVHMNR